MSSPPPSPLSTLPAHWDSLCQPQRGLDAFATSSVWAESARLAFAPEAMLITHPFEDAALACLAFVHEEGGPILTGLDIAWGYASCWVGAPSAPRLEEALAAVTARVPRWRFWVWTGLLDASPLPLLLRRKALASGWNFLPWNRSINRCTSVDGDIASWLARRSPASRRRFRRIDNTWQRLQDQGWTYDEQRPSALDVAGCAQRLWSVEAQSWKTLGGVGAYDGQMRRFCDEVLYRAARGGQLRVAFLRDPSGRDVAYYSGAVHHGAFRGLQMSYVSDAPVEGVGTLLHWLVVRSLCDDPELRLYDLGMEMPYKAGWAEQLVHYPAYVLVRNL